LKIWSEYFDPESICDKLVSITVFTLVIYGTSRTHYDLNIKDLGVKEGASKEMTGEDK
jgi:hypothetical protein